MKKKIIVFFTVITLMLGIILPVKEVEAYVRLDMSTYKHVINFVDPVVSDDNMLGHAYCLAGGGRASYVISVVDSGKYTMQFTEFSESGGYYVLLNENEKEIDSGLVYSGHEVEYELGSGKYQLNILADKDEEIFNYEFIFASNNYKMGETKTFQYENIINGTHVAFNEKFGKIKEVTAKNKEISRDKIFYGEAELVAEHANEYTIRTSEKADYSLAFIKIGEETFGTGYYVIETMSGDELFDGYIRYTKEFKSSDQIVNIKSLPAGTYKLKIGAVSPNFSYKVAVYNMETMINHMWYPTCFRFAMPAMMYSISDTHIVDIESREDDDAKVIFCTKKNGVAIVTAFKDGKYYANIWGVYESNDKNAEVYVSFKKGSDGGIKPYIAISNKCSNSIKKVAFDVYYYNKKGRKLKNKKGNNNMTRLTYSNGIAAWTTKSLDYNNVFYNKAVNKIVVEKIAVTYSNGKTKTYVVNTEGYKN